jgi:1,4-dihydroxy-2-naphthoate polyprenyltransferase
LGREKDALPIPLHGLFVSARLFYLGGGLALYALGALLGRGGGSAAALLLGGAVVTLVHLLTHFVNDAEDVDTDAQTLEPTALTGGSRAIQRGLITPAQLLRASAVLAVGVLGLVLAAALQGDFLGAALYLGMLVLGYAYSGRPFALGTRGLGELTAATVMGLLVPLAGAHAAGGITSEAWSVVPLLVLMTVFARLCTAYPDIAADRATRKWTVPALLGPRASAVAFGAVAVAIAVAGALGSAPGGMLAAIAAGAAALVVAALVATGKVHRAPVVAPVLGTLGYGSGLLILAAAALGV